jgi:chromosome segregation protein
MGNVNLEAIHEQSELEEREVHLMGQMEDLQKAEKALKDIINKINITSRELFEKTFNEVRIHFHELFRKMFGGGRADIILEEGVDILDAGIDIVAQPPGKELKSIMLFSGGEKVMTTIALLFAIFKSKPSPFCILDEVDAALDENNIGRFTQILKEFAMASQFVIITHSKQTMTIADVIYGVTMEEPGVSKKISVKFEEAQRQVA